MPANHYALPDGAELSGYRIVRVLGAGGFSITYEARHGESNARVALKEYLPFGYGTRVPGSSTVESAPGDEGEIFRWGRDRFMKEAQTLARLDHPSIVQVSGYFEANNTAYMALAYEEGGTLAEWLKRLGRTPTQDEMSGVAWSLTDALAHVHSLFLLHRDIKPQNIMLRHDRTPVLIDFGTAKAALVGHTRVLGGATAAAAASSLVVVSDGYSPPEQGKPARTLD
jgi:serine/threonine protein kinase